MDPATIVAGLPDLEEASLVPFTAVVGALVGSAAARLLRRGRHDVRQWAEDGAFIGALMGLMTYLIALVVGV